MVSGLKAVPFSSGSDAKGIWNTKYYWHRMQMQCKAIVKQDRTCRHTYSIAVCGGIDLSAGSRNEPLRHIHRVSEFLKHLSSGTVVVAGRMTVTVKTRADEHIGFLVPEGSVEPSGLDEIRGLPECMDTFQTQGLGELKGVYQYLQRSSNFWLLYELIKFQFVAFHVLAEFHLLNQTFGEVQPAYITVDKISYSNNSRIATVPNREFVCFTSFRCDARGRSRFKAESLRHLGTLATRRKENASIIPSRACIPAIHFDEDSRLIFDCSCLVKIIELRIEAIFGVEWGEVYLLYSHGPNDWVMHSQFRACAPI
ncbi:hypothetical protein DFH06DRAFT_1140344 [Mycena polygramma]|nr:hypothetical protein DFH06DRAFT_1140344 [Mycena polygramma]